MGAASPIWVRARQLWQAGWVAEEAALPSLMLYTSSAAARPQPWHPKPQLPVVSQAGACGAGPRSSGGKGEKGDGESCPPMPCPEVGGGKAAPAPPEMKE